VDRETLAEAVYAVAKQAGSRVERAQHLADLIRASTGRRWVGVYQVTRDKVVNLAWSGPSAPAHPSFSVGDGLTGAAIEARESVLSNDVAHDPRYLTALTSTGSELVVPIVIGAGVVGTLDVEDERSDAFGPDDQRLFERAAGAMGPLFVEWPTPAGP
jgi:putative methionine-R-sulfoxide reductase with GAF domain